MILSVSKQRSVLCFYSKQRSVWCFFVGSVSIFMIFHLLQVAGFGSFFRCKLTLTWMLRLQVLVGSLVVPHGVFFE